MNKNNFFIYFILQFFTKLQLGYVGVSMFRPLLMGTIVSRPERCTCIVGNILII